MAATRVIVQLPPTYNEEVPVKWYGAPSVAEIEGACRAAIGAKLQGLETSDPLILVDEDGGTLALTRLPAPLPPLTGVSVTAVWLGHALLLQTRLC
jgi:hypothetical protein